MAPLSKGSWLRSRLRGLYKTNKVTTTLISFALLNSFPRRGSQVGVRAHGDQGRGKRGKNNTTFLYNKNEKILVNYLK